MIPTIGVDETAFRRACARFATGITIASVLDASGSPHGLTVNSFTSISLRPPLVLISIDYTSNVLPYFRASTYYGISVLAERHHELSTRFAQKGMDRFNGIESVRGETGVPLVPGALAHFECATRQVIEAGDHAIFLAEVVRIECRDGDPLLYFNSAYRGLRD